jgi:hypothetical protein
VSELTETQKAYNVAQSKLFQLAAYGHCTYTNGEMLTREGQRQQRDYNDRITTAREQLEAAVLRLVAEKAQTFRGDWGVVAAWLRSLADDPAEVSLLACAPEEDEDEPGRPVEVQDPRQPAYDAVFAYIRQQPRDFLPTTVVERNAVIWSAVHAALDAIGFPGTPDKEA